MKTENMNKEFTFLGYNIENITILYGMFLIFWGVSVTVLSDSQSITSLIPAVFGLPLTILSYCAKRFTEKKKVFMHIVVLIVFCIFLGGLDIIRGFFSGNVLANLWASSSKIMMLASGLLFTTLYIKYFIFNRRNKL